MLADEENKGLAVTVLEALNTLDLSLWAQKLADDYAAESLGARAEQNPKHRVQRALRGSVPRVTLRHPSRPRRG